MERQIQYNTEFRRYLATRIFLRASLWLTGLHVFLGGLLVARAQSSAVYQSYQSETSFFSEAPLEDISAVNNGGASVINFESGEMVFVVPIRGFQFRKSLMQEHFNENYLESDRYPTAVFKGTLLDFNPQAEGIHPVRARGTLQLHGVEKQIQASGTLQWKGDELELRCSFPVALADYDISIPRLVVKNIAEVVDVTLVYLYRPKAEKK